MCLLREVYQVNCWWKVRIFQFIPSFPVPLDNNWSSNTPVLTVSKNNCSHNIAYIDKVLQSTAVLTFTVICLIKWSSIKEEIHISAYCLVKEAISSVVWVPWWPLDYFSEFKIALTQTHTGQSQFWQFSFTNYNSLRWLQTLSFLLIVTLKNVFNFSIQNTLWS